jgi:hypothetical protein
MRPVGRMQEFSNIKAHAAYIATTVNTCFLNCRVATHLCEIAKFSRMVSYVVAFAGKVAAFGKCICSRRNIA